MSDARWFIESEAFRRAVGGPVHVLDGGSLGGAIPPFDEIAADVAVTGFDPDAAPGDRKSIRRALWRESGTVEVHIAASRSASSVYPPNAELLRQFPNRIGVEARRTERVASVEAISVDDAVAEGLCEPPDFIKLDVHSAEYEVLAGASRALETATGVLVETWHSPVHAGQRLHGDVERRLNGAGFHLFDHCVAAAWRHTLDGETDRRDRPRLIASESLFFRDFGGRRPAPRDGWVTVALLDLYGYTNRAVALSREFAEAGVLDANDQREAERELLALREARSAAVVGAAPNAGGPRLRRWAGGVLAALRGRPVARQAEGPAPHPLETGTQRLSTGPWR